jgi:hypothetical protein
MIEVKGIFVGTNFDASDIDIAFEINKVIDSIANGNFEEIKVDTLDD